jgi:hypothetical protein
MPSVADSDKSVKMVHIEGANRTISTDSPYKKLDDIEGEINELKSIKTKLQNDMKDQKWEKIPKIFKYAAELHTKEALGLHSEIVRLKSENLRLKKS